MRPWAELEADVPLLRAWLDQPEDAAPPWPDATNRVIELHYYAVVYLEKPEWESRADELQQVVRLCHAALARLPQCAKGFVELELWFATRLSEAGRFELALQFLDDFSMPWAAGRSEGVKLRIYRSGLLRRLFRWREAKEALDAIDAADTAAPELCARTLTARGHLALEMGTLDLAAEMCRRLRELPQDVLRPQTRLEAAILEARVQQLLGRADRALALWREFAAEAIARDPKNLASVCALKTRCAIAALDDPSAALEVLQAGDALLQEVLAVPTLAIDERWLARNIMARRLLDRGDHAGAAANLTDLPGQDHQPEQAIDERRLGRTALRARLALDRGDSTAEVEVAARALEQAFDRMLTAWAELPVSRDGFGPLLSEVRRRALAELIRCRIRLLGGTAGAEAAARDVIRAQSLGSLARSVSADAADLATIRAALTSADSGVLLFVPGHERTHVLAIDGAKIVEASSPTGARRLDELRNRLLQSVFAVQAAGGTGAAAVSEAAHQLAGVLLPPAVRSAIAGWRAVAIAGADVLGYVPFELLPDGDGVLGHTRVVTYLPSLTVGHWLAAGRVLPAATPRPRVRVLACPDITSPENGVAAALPFGATEHELLAGAIAPATFGPRSGATVDRRSWHDAGLAQLEFLQFVGHGLRDESRVDSHGILLGDGSVLWPKDIEKLQLPRLVFFAACRAGGGRLRRGDDGRHLLAGTALLAGARAVIVPWIDVDYRATLDLVSALHRQLWQLRLPLGEALRRARIECAAQAPGALEPLMFHLVGLADAVPGAALPVAAAPAPPAPRRWVAPLVFAAVLALAAAGLWRHQRRRGRRLTA